VHGVCGIWGTLSLGLFAVGNYGGVKGILYGGNANQLVAQIKGSAVITAATLAAGLLLMFGVKAIGILRVSEAGEIEGLDIHDHGAPAYHPEYAYMGYSPLPPSVEAAAGAAVSGPPSDIHLPTSD
jgi:Amt family ammonium transporter